MPFQIIRKLLQRVSSVSFNKHVFNLVFFWFFGFNFVFLFILFCIFPLLNGALEPFSMLAIDLFKVGGVFVCPFFSLYEKNWNRKQLMTDATQPVFFI